MQLDKRHVSMLRAQGYLPRGVMTRPDVERAAEQYCAQMQIACDSRIIQRELDKPRFCSVPDRQGGGTKCRWDGTKRPLKITWAIAGTIPGISRDVLERIYAEAWARWASVCGIAPEYAPGQRADVTMTHGGIDGSGQTLAWSELPCGRDRPLAQKYDTGEAWFSEFGQPAGGRISLVAVACHEIGHAIGLEHLGEGNLLAPYYTPTIRTPQRGDIAEAQLRYGPPVTTPTPAPQPDPPTGDDWHLEVRLLKGSTDVAFAGSVQRTK